jgi:hypothetical protein
MVVFTSFWQTEHFIISIFQFKKLKVVLISLVYKSGKYREVLLGAIKPDDTVIEVGPHVGNTTKALAGKTKRLIAVDKAEQSKKAMEKLDNVEFVQGDVRFFDTIRKVQQLTKSCDVLAFDMGGGRFPDTVFKIWAVWSGVFRPRESVIRNRGLSEFVQRVRIQDEYLIREFDDSGWLHWWGRKNPRQLQEGIEEMKYWLSKK